MTLKESNVHYMCICKSLLIETTILNVKLNIFNTLESTCI